jgi:CRISPR system Cascade subunit CasE
MYLSKLILDPSHPHARRDLADAYQMHRTLSRAFVTTTDAPPRRFLWRIENNRPNTYADQSVLLVQSADPGAWQALMMQPGYAHSIHPNKKVDLTELLREGRRYRFRIAANPTVTRAGKRLGLLREDAQQEWLARQGDRHGFRLLESVRTANGRLTVKQEKTGYRITVHVVRFDGFLEATDAEALSKALLGGIGRAKALGLGMLSLAPVRI